MINQLDDDQQRSTFRKRRLSLPLLSAPEKVPADDSDDSDDGEGKAEAPTLDSVSNTAAAEHATRKRNQPSTTPSPCLNAKKARLEEAEPRKTTPTTRTVHAGEIASTETPSTEGPAWKNRFIIDPVHEVDKLPFNPSVVATFSCHGIEPVETYYGEEYAPEPDGDSNKFLQPFLSSEESDNPQTVSSEEDESEVTVNIETTAKINQDRGGVSYPYAKVDNMALFAVYDGHGPGGEGVSQFSLNEVQRCLEKHPSFPSNLPQALTETFLAVDRSLITEPDVDPLLAGSTACVAVLHNTMLTLANVGDSRAVCARRVQSGSLSAIDLTWDQNPDIPAEMDRIQRHGGFVTLPPEPGLSARVWLDEACTQVGLAMARSLGDHAAASVGVVAEPVITTHRVEENDQFMVLATDGVWEFLSSQDVVDLVGKHMDKGASTACQILIEEAAERWRQEEGAYRDDITAIVVTLPNLFSAAS